MFCNLSNRNQKTIIMKGLLIVGMLLIGSFGFSQEKQKDANYYKYTIVGVLERREMQAKKQQQKQELQKEKQNSRVYIKDKMEVPPKRMDK